MAASVTRLRSSFTALSLASVVLVPVLLGHAGAQALTRWSGLAAGLSVALGLALVPRGAADFYARVAPRLASAAVTVELAVWWVRTADGSASLVVDLGLVGGAALFASVLAAGGYRSIGLSRLGDALQLLAVLVGPVAALVGSGLLELLRGAVS
jgi:hypothetical protein